MAGQECDITSVRLVNFTAAVSLHRMVGMVTTGVGLHNTILSHFYRRCYIAGEIRRRNGSRAPIDYSDRPALLESPQMVRGKNCNHNNVLEGFATRRMEQLWQVCLHLHWWQNCW